MSTNETARPILARYAKLIKNVAYHITDTFAPSAEYDDTYQEVTILLMSYAGILPGRHNGSLARIELVEYPEALLATQLRLDMYDIVGKRLSRIKPTYSLTEVLEKEADPLDDYLEDRIIDQVDATRDVFTSYPYLCMSVLDDMQQDEISRLTGINERTVRRRIAEEKARLITDHPEMKELKNAS